MPVRLGSILASARRPQSVQVATVGVSRKASRRVVHYARKDFIAEHGPSLAFHAKLASTMAGKGRRAAARVMLERSALRRMPPLVTIVHRANTKVPREPPPAPVPFRASLSDQQGLVLSAHALHPLTPPRKRTTAVSVSMTSTSIPTESQKTTGGRKVGSVCVAPRVPPAPSAPPSIPSVLSVANGVRHRPLLCSRPVPGAATHVPVRTTRSKEGRETTSIL